MVKSVFFVLALCCLSAVRSDVFAQRPDRGGSGRQRGGSFSLPKVGDQLPAIGVYDESGNEFSTKTLREHYSVIVFGCLT